MAFRKSPVEDASHRWSFILIAIVAVAAYSNSFDADFTFDNVSLVQKNPLVIGDEPPGEAFKHDFWWPTNDVGFYRPLLILTFRLQYALAGQTHRLFDYHAMNLILHILNGCLLYMLLMELLGQKRIALTASLIWLVHPLNVECVTNLIGRADSLAALTMLTGLYLHARRPNRVDRFGDLKWTFLICLILFAGTLTKEQAFLLPGAILLYDLTVGFKPESPPPSRPWTRQFLDVYLPLLGTIALSFAIRAYIFRDAHVIGRMGWNDPPNEPQTFLESLLTAIKIVGLYISLIFWPARLSCDYSYNQVPKVTLPMNQADLSPICIALLVLSILVYLAWKNRAHGAGISFCALFAILAYFPSFHSTFVVGGIMAERWMYIPMMGLMPVCVQAISNSMDRIASRVRTTTAKSGLAFYFISAVILIASSIRTYERNFDWQNAVALWTSSRAAAPNSFKTHYGLAFGWSLERLKDPRLYSSPASADALYDKPEFVRYRDVYRFLYPMPEHRQAALLDLMIQEAEESVRCAPNLVQNRDQLAIFYILRAKGAAYTAGEMDSFPASGSFEAKDIAWNLADIRRAVDVLKVAVEKDAEKRLQRMNRRGSHGISQGKFNYPLYKPVYVRLSVAHQMLGETGAALEVIHRFRRANPMASDAHEQAANVLLAMNEGDTAMHYLCQALLTAHPSEGRRIAEKILEYQTRKNSRPTSNIFGPYVKSAVIELVSLLRAAGLEKDAQKIVFLSRTILGFDPDA